MKTANKWLILSATIIVALCVIIIFKINCRWRPAPDPIPLAAFSKELVPLDSAKQHQAVFDTICVKIFKPYDKNKNKVPYGGGILRNTDVLLSLGLNNADLYNYVQCENLRLKTMLGYDMVKNKIKMYAHPVEIQINGTDTVIVDLVFNKLGNLFYAKTGAPWLSSCKKCISCSVPPDVGSADHKLKLGDGDMFVIDLNNPCPPCD